MWKEYGDWRGARCEEPTNTLVWINLFLQYFPQTLYFHTHYDLPYAYTCLPHWTISLYLEKGSHLVFKTTEKTRKYLQLYYAPGNLLDTLHISSFSWTSLQKASSSIPFSERETDAQGEYEADTEQLGSGEANVNWEIFCLDNHGIFLLKGTQ